MVNDSIYTILLVIVIILIILFSIIIIVIFVYLDESVTTIIKEIEETVAENTEINPKTNYEIDYAQQDPIPTGFMGNDFSKDIGILLARCNMSAVIYGSLVQQGQKPPYDLKLPPELTLISTVGSRAILLKRTGSDFYILANRGTLTTTDIIDDFAAGQVDFVNLDGQNLSKGLVQSGIYQNWKGLTSGYNNIWGMIPANSQLAITGHSEGCGHAQFTTLSYHQKTDKTVDLLMYVYAPPRIGNHIFTDTLETAVPNSWAIINQNDIVPSVPPSSFIVSSAVYLYDELTNRVISDFQAGSLSGDHNLDSYLCSIDPTAKECPSSVWSNPARQLCALSDNSEPVPFDPNGNSGSNNGIINPTDKFNNPNNDCDFDDCCYDTNTSDSCNSNSNSCNSNSNSHCHDSSSCSPSTSHGHSTSNSCSPSTSHGHSTSTSCSTHSSHHSNNDCDDCYDTNTNTGSEHSKSHSTHSHHSSPSHHSSHHSSPSHHSNDCDDCYDTNTDCNHSKSKSESSHYTPSCKTPSSSSKSESSCTNSNSTSTCDYTDSGSGEECPNNYNFHDYPITPIDDRLYNENDQQVDMLNNSETHKMNVSPLALLNTSTSEFSYTTSGDYSFAVTSPIDDK